VTILNKLNKGHPFKMKIESPELKSIFTEELRCLSSIFLKHKFEVKLAGGAV
ncbi:hypothetical protein QYM36_006276, partial [Artemia franciscana]